MPDPFSNVAKRTLRGRILDASIGAVVGLASRVWPVVPQHEPLATPKT